MINNVTVADPSTADNNEGGQHKMEESLSL